MGIPQSGSGFLGVVMIGFWLVMIAYWVVVAWRSMRALEGIDESLRERSPR